MMILMKINQKKSKLILTDFKIQMMNLEILKGMKMLIFNILKNSKILTIKNLEIVILARIKETLSQEIMKSVLSPQIMKEGIEWL